MVLRAFGKSILFMLMIVSMICGLPTMLQAKEAMGDIAGSPPVVVSGAADVESMLSRAASHNGVSLQNAIQAAIEANPTFLGRKHAYSASHEAYLKSFGALLPHVNFTAKGGYVGIRNDTTIALYDDHQGEEWVDDMRVVLSQLVFDGGLTSAKAEADQYLSQSRKEELFNTAEDVGLTATQCFMEVLRNRALIELSEHNIARHADILELTRVRLSSGGGTQVDVDQAGASLEEARSRLVHARQGLADAEAEYLKVFGSAPDQLAMPGRPVQAIPQSVEQGIAQAMDNNRALKAARLAILQNESEVESAKGRLMPKLQAELSGSTSENTGGYEQSYHDVSAMLQLSFNIFNGGSDQAAIREAKSEASKAVQDAEEVRREVEEDVRTAYNFYEATGKLIPILRDLTNKNADTVVSYADQFRMGKRTLLDLVSAQKSLFSSQQVYLNAMAAHTFSYYRICMPISTLMSTLGVDVNVPEVN